MKLGSRLRRWGIGYGDGGGTILSLANAPEFQVAALPYPDTQTRVLFFVFGVVAGLVGIAYNGTLLAAIRWFGRFDRWPVELRAGLVGAGIGLVACFAPGVVGGGEVLTQRTFDQVFPLELMLAIIVVRFVLGPCRMPRVRLEGCLRRCLLSVPSLVCCSVLLATTSG